MKTFSPINDTDNIGILHKVRASVTCESITAVGIEYLCENSLDYTNITSYFCSNRVEPNAWIKYYFPFRNIAITNYSIRAPDAYNIFGGGPDAYKVEGSINGQTYLLDEVQQSDLKEPGSIQTRPVNRIDSYDYIKITMTGNNTFDKYELRIANFDVFGVFTPVCQSIKKGVCTHLYILMNFLMI